MPSKALTNDTDASSDECNELPLAALRAEWLRVYRRSPPPRLSRDLLIRGIAYRKQEQAQGGLRPAAKRKLAAWAAKLGQGNDGVSDTTAAIRLKPGAVLVRTWRGQTHSIRVLDDGFEYLNERHASLSQVATRITGAHWSGPRFFGLVRRQKQHSDE